MARFIIKVGGAMAKADIRHNIAADLAKLMSMGHQIVLVHGGGPQLDEAIIKEGRSIHKVSGRRVTSFQDLELAVQVWEGRVAVQWLQSIQQSGARARHISARSSHVIQAIRRPPVEISNDDGHRISVDFGYVGDITSVETGLLNRLCRQSIIPVLSPLAIDPQGDLLNINADTVAARIAMELKADHLILLSNIDGIYTDAKNPSSRLERLSPSQTLQYIASGTITGGMRPKVEAILDVLQHNVGQVTIANGNQHGVLSKILLDKLLLGTTFESGLIECVNDFR